MSGKIICIKIDDSMSNKEIDKIINNLNNAFEDTNYRILYDDDNVDIEIYDPDVMKDVRKDLRELKELMINSVYTADKKGIDYDELEIIESGGE